MVFTRAASHAVSFEGVVVQEDTTSTPKRAVLGDVTNKHLQYNLSADKNGFGLPAPLEDKKGKLHYKLHL